MNSRHFDTGWIRAFLLVLTATMALAAVTAAPPARAQTLEIEYTPAAPDMPPTRRLYADSARPKDAPSSLMIEVAGIQDDAQTALQLAIKASNAHVLAYGVNDPRRTVSMINLGSTRLRAGQALQARRDFVSALERIDAEDGTPRDARVAEAYYGLGASQFALGFYRNAVESFEEGLQVHRAVHGLSSESQLDFLRALAIGNRVLGSQDAKAWQARRVAVAEQAFAQDPERLAWHYLDAGRWFRKAKLDDEAVAMHIKAVRTVEASRGRESPLLITPLLDVAISGISREPKPGQLLIPGDLLPGTALQRARNIVLQHHDQQMENPANALEGVANIHWLFKQKNDALKLYSLAAARGKTSALAQPAFLVFDPPDAKDAAGHEGHLLAEFLVDKSGRARDVALVEGSSIALREQVGPKLLRALRVARYRPRLIDGKPEATRVRYRYQHQAPASASRRSAAADAPKTAMGAG